MYLPTSVVVVATSPVTHSPATRALKRARHLYKDGKDLHQTSSPKLDVAATSKVITQFREKAALREQQHAIQKQDASFIEELFTTDIPTNAVLDYLAS